MAVFFLFIDGLGLGAEAETNPLATQRYPGLELFCGGGPLLNHREQRYESDILFTGVDATLDMEGLPQSGTGQTALFTGENAARIIGKHFGPFPHSGIKPLLKKQSLFQKASSMGKRGLFINAYPGIFFERAKKRGRWSCTTLMTKSAGQRLLSEQDVKEGRAITAEITQEAWRDVLGIDVPEITPETAGARMLAAASESRYDLVLFEYYLTDKAGHSRDRTQAEEVLRRVDRMICFLMENREPQDTLVICSDHGNIEDLSTKTHTLNAVPLLAAGPGASRLREARSIIDVTPGILDILTI